MRNQTLAIALTVYTLTSAQGCASHGETQGTAISGSENIPGADPALVHYIAWIPRSSAQTPAVAAALAHISMGYAKEQVGAEFCDGDWLMDKPVSERIGPIPAIAPEAIGKYPAWYYRVSLQPGFDGCRNASAAVLYPAIQGKLPGWMYLEPATVTSPGTAALFD